MNKCLCLEKKKVNVKDFCPKQVQLGMKSEKEHTKDKEIAKQITADHLKEDPNYYTKLQAMEHKEAFVKGFMKAASESGCDKLLAVELLNRFAA